MPYHADRICSSSLILDNSQSVLWMPGVLHYPSRQKHYLYSGNRHQQDVPLLQLNHPRHRTSLLAYRSPRRSHHVPQFDQCP